MLARRDRERGDRRGVNRPCRISGAEQTRLTTCLPGCAIPVAHAGHPKPFVAEMRSCSTPRNRRDSSVLPKMLGLPSRCKLAYRRTRRARSVLGARSRSRGSVIAGRSLSLVEAQVDIARFGQWAFTLRSDSRQAREAVSRIQTRLVDLTTAERVRDHVLPANGFAVPQVGALQRVVRHLLRLRCGAPPTRSRRAQRTAPDRPPRSRGSDVSASPLPSLAGLLLSARGPSRCVPSSALGHGKANSARGRS